MLDPPIYRQVAEDVGYSPERPIEEFQALPVVVPAEPATAPLPITGGA